MFVLAKLFYLYPRFQRDGIPRREIEFTIRTGIVEHIMCPLAIKFDGMIVRFKVRIFGGTRARNVAVHSTHRLESRGFFFAKVPSHDGLIVRKRRNGVTRSQYEKGNKEDWQFHSAGPAQEGSGWNTWLEFLRL